MNLKKIQRVQVLNSSIHKLSFSESIDIIKDFIRKKEVINHIVVNAGKLVAMQHDELLYKSLRDADMVNPDGQSIVWASKLFGDSLPERISGIDVMEHLVDNAKEDGFKCFFFGAKEEVVKKVVEIYKEKYGEEIIAGYRNGYYSPEEESEIAKQIANSNADMLFVAITSPKKEIFLDKYKDVIKVPFSMGVGGSFDVISGLTKRAPLWMQKIGMEWFFRLIQEPKRMWRRYLIGNFIFVWLILKQKVGLYKNPFS